MGDAKPDAEALTVACPACRAAIGVECVLLVPPEPIRHVMRELTGLRLSASHDPYWNGYEHYARIVAAGPPARWAGGFGQKPNDPTPHPAEASEPTRDNLEQGVADTPAKAKE